MKYSVTLLIFPYVTVLVVCPVAGVCGKQPEVSSASRTGTEQQAVSRSSGGGAD